MIEHLRLQQEPSLNPPAVLHSCIVVILPKCILHCSIEHFLPLLTSTIYFPPQKFLFLTIQHLRLTHHLLLTHKPPQTIGVVRDLVIGSSNQYQRGEDKLLAGSESFTLEGHTCCARS